MYSKDDLLSKDIPELLDIAEALNADFKSDDDKETIIYAILDRQAVVEGSKNPATTKRKRVRITKKDTDHVYSVSGKEGENYDLKKSKPAIEQPSLFSDLPELPPEEIPEEAPAKPAPAKRGRKSKAEKEALAAQALAEAQANQPEEPSSEPIVEQTPLEEEAPVAPINEEPSLDVPPIAEDIINKLKKV